MHGCFGVEFVHFYFHLCFLTCSSLALFTLHFLYSESKSLPLTISRGFEGTWLKQVEVQRAKVCAEIEAKYCFYIFKESSNVIILFYPPLFVPRGGGSQVKSPHMIVGVTQLVTVPHINNLIGHHVASGM